MWTTSSLERHLQQAAELELWTIPFYMSAFYSIEDRNCRAARLIRGAMVQEMLHLQCVLNIANAYGTRVTLGVPQYSERAIPHLKFSDSDPSQATDEHKNWDARLGPFDPSRLDAMCIVEWPFWPVPSEAVLKKRTKDYDNIGQFYRALREGAEEMREDVRGGTCQVDHFAAHYRGMPSLTVTEWGTAGFLQASNLLQLIMEQGEGGDDGVKVDSAGAPHLVRSEYRPSSAETAGDALMSHFAKFRSLVGQPFPAVREAKEARRNNEHVRRLRDAFHVMLREMMTTFAGGDPAKFGPAMFRVGAAIDICWKNGVVPRL